MDQTGIPGSQQWKKKVSHSPVLYTYLRKYQEDPTSRVFAPLAEAYRKAGLIDDAIEIAREGLRYHPRFIGGKVALARALFDKQKYEDVTHELQPVILEAPDNLIAQRLFAESCLMLSRTAEALNSFKMLLYFHPSDADTAKIVRELESTAYEKGTLLLKTDSDMATADQFDIKPAKSAMSTPNPPSPGQKPKAIQKIEYLQNLLQRVERYRNSGPGADNG